MNSDQDSVGAASRRSSQTPSGGTPLPPSSALPDPGSSLFHAFDESEPIANVAGKLPHWRQAGTTYFVTFRTADSLPQGMLHQWESERAAWLRAHPEPHAEAEREEYLERFPRRLQHWLDQGHGACVLLQPELKVVVENALLHFDGERYDLREFTVAANHVHALVTPRNEHELSEIEHSWKSYTAHLINKRLGRSGPYWQKESFDHIVRNPASLEKFVHYIRNHPGVSAAR